MDMYAEAGVLNHPKKRFQPLGLAAEGVVFHEQVAHLSQPVPAVEQDVDFCALNIELQQLDRLHQVIAQPRRRDLHVLVGRTWMRTHCGEISTVASHRREPNRTVLGPNRFPPHCHAAKIAGIFLQGGKRFGIGLERDDARLRIELLPVAHTQSDVGPAIQNQRSLGRRAKLILLSLEVRPIDREETLRVRDDQLAVQQPGGGVRKLRQPSQPRQLGLLGMTSGKLPHATAFEVPGRLPDHRRTGLADDCLHGLIH